jgi:hypothetical protein
MPAGGEGDLGTGPWCCGRDLVLTTEPSGAGVTGVRGTRSSVKARVLLRLAEAR